MKLGAAIAEIMKREGIQILTGYPVNHLIEYAADADIRPIMVRQERIGLHMADAISRVTSGRTIGAFCMQHGPGAENAYGGVAQCYGESVPVLVLPMGYPRRIAHIDQLHHLAFCDHIGGVSQNLHYSHIVHRNHHLERARVKEVAHQHRGSVTEHGVSSFATPAQR